MAAHQLGPGRRVTGPGGYGLLLGQRFGELEQLSGRQGLTLADADQPVLQLGGIGAEVVAFDPPARALGLARKVGQHGIDAIGAGAAHQPQHPHQA
jgi:hypothetical protein